MDVIKVIDSHTAGEPTRVVVSGGPDLGSGPMSERRLAFQQKCDDLRCTVIGEPRGSDVLVGALLCEPTLPECCAGVVFFNNAGVLQMCGHGTIGLVATLAWMKKISPGVHRIETPVGIVTTTLHDQNKVSIQNVPSYRSQSGVAVEVPGVGSISGDVAWGGNWFFLCKDHGLDISLKNVAQLTDITLRIRDALTRCGITGDDGGEIDHIELFGPPSSPNADSRNFVLCPGGAYDRSPCGTGTSAKLACLAADGSLPPGTVWRQESIVGSVFEASWQPAERYEQTGAVLPTISGSAWVTAESSLILDPTDPFRHGIHS